MFKKSLILLVISLLAAINLTFRIYGALPAADSTATCSDSIVQSSQTGFRPTQLILPATLITVGAFGVDNGFLVKVKEKVRDGFQDFRGNNRWHGDDYIQYLPAAAYIGLGFLNTSPKHNFAQRLSAGVTAYAFMGIMVNGTKLMVDEKRPDSGAMNSFPSGHTATAFMGAELVRLEYPWPYALGAYTVATLTAVLRLYNDRHWANDLLAGAGIGILSARMAYWMLPLYNKWFFKGKNDRRGGQTRMIAPGYDPVRRAPTLTAVCIF